nr:hypothetical protein [uncultured Rhodopila sp.]
MQKLAGLLIIAMASITAGTSIAAVVPRAAPVPSAVASARGAILLVRGGMAPGSIGGMNPGSVGGMNAGGMNTGGMEVIGGPGPGNLRGSDESTCAPSFWNRVFGSPATDRCAAVRTSAAKDQGPTKHVVRTAPHMVRQALRSPRPAKTADASLIGSASK